MAKGLLLFLGGFSELNFEFFDASPGFITLGGDDREHVGGLGIGSLERFFGGEKLGIRSRGNIELALGFLQGTGEVVSGGLAEGAVLPGGEFGRINVEAMLAQNGAANGNGNEDREPRIRRATSIDAILDRADCLVGGK